jgi:putative ABC transport system permease protein
LVGLRSKVATFQVQRTVNDYRQEPLTAILPGVALAELWGLMGVAENALLVVSACVVVVGLSDARGAAAG